MRALCLWLAALAPGLGAAALPTVASINLCTDQLLLHIAAPEQILSLSWLSANPEESMLADSAAAYPLNFGAAEELLRIGAEVVIAGSATSPFTRQLLQRLGATVVEIEPATSLDDIARNLRRIGAAIDREQQAEVTVASLQARAQAIRARRPDRPRSAVVVRPGGYTIARETLAFELLTLAGLENSIAELDRWGSLSIESLLRERPQYLVITRYRADEASLANNYFAHPALAELAESPTVLSVESRYFACGAPESLHVAETLLEQMASP